MTKEERPVTVPFVIVQGPRCHDIMNSFAGSHLGDAYPVSFTIRIRRNMEWVLTSKVVGVGAKDDELKNLFDLRIQLINRLSQYNPIRLDLVDLTIEFYRGIERTGQGRMTLTAFRELGFLNR
jgi:hypothetical protein